MAAPTLAELGKVIIKQAPRGLSNKTVYLARRSFDPGKIPTHLTPYVDRFTQTAPRCAAAIQNVPHGPSRVKAMRACMSQNLKGM